ncbi:Iterative polyketide synthase CazM 8 [Seiridium cupressi]
MGSMSCPVIEMAPLSQRLLPSLVDEIAVNDPERIFYSISKTRDPKDGFLDLTAKTFAGAVDRVAWYLEENLGRGQDFPTLTYLGPQDVIYAVLVLATIKAGYKLLLNSPRNTLDAHLFLFEETQCSTFLLPPNFPLPVVKQILAARQMKVLEIPELQHWTEGEPKKPYPYTKTFAEARLDPFVVLHTSGSTGMPKPIIQPHATVVQLDTFTTLPSLGYQPTYPAMCAGMRLYLCFPLFHCAGISILLSSIFCGFTVVLGPSPPSSEAINAVHVHGNVQHSCLAPASIVDLVKNPEYLENLARLQQVTYGGGPLPQAVGDVVTNKTRLMNCLGSTECGVLPIQHCDPEDWAYLSYSPVLGSEFREVSDGLYEHFIVRRKELHPYQGIFGTFPELEEWPMKDLYSRHPSKKDAWLYRGRTDDIIVFSTGEKLNPVDLEHIITTDPAISAAIIAGVGRFQSSLLVEAVKPPGNDVERNELLGLIWPSIQAANKESPSYGRIHKNMILLTTAEKPMLRAGKGTVQRKLSLDLYAQELDALYRANEQALSRPTEASSVLQDGNGSIHDAVKRIVAESTDLDMAQVSLDANLFELGLDSLQVVSITKAINRLLSSRGIAPFQIKVVYSNPSILALIEAVLAVVEGRDQTLTDGSDEDRLQKLLDLYATNMPITARKPEPQPSDGAVALLTGSTGSLGSYILDSLLSNAEVKHIYCLNRGPGSSERQRKSQAAKGLQDLPSKKVEFFDADLTKPYFGLDTQQYRALLREVTLVIHNAWQVDFNLSVKSYAKQIGAVRRFVDFSAQSKFSALLFFISSISAVGGLPHDNPIPEKTFDSWKTPQRSGYGQSKFVAERLLDIANKEAEVPTTIYRLGQIAGPTSEAGVWPKQEWLPSLIASSKFLGKLPETLGQLETVDWVPVDEVGRSVVELATKNHAIQSTETGAVVYHGVNPQKTTWARLAPTIHAHLTHEKQVHMVSMETWVQALRKSACTIEAGEVAHNPAVILLEFFEGITFGSTEFAALDTSKAVAASPTLTGLTEIQEPLVENWLRQWAF